MTMSRIVRGVVAAACVCAAALLGTAPAHADEGDISLSVLRVSSSEIHVGICLSDAALVALPFSPVIEYDLTSSAGTVSATWSFEEPDAAVIKTNPCPAEFVSFAITCLEASTSYTFTARATLTPRLRDEPEVVDAERPVRSSQASISATTSAGRSGCPPEDDGSGDTGLTDAGPGGTAPAATGPSGSGSADPAGSPGPVTVTPSNGVTSEVPSGSDAEPLPVVIARPQEFRAAQLAALSPEQVARIEPRTFGLLPPAAFVALKPAQAAVLTPEQASAIRPARAASLSPAAVRSLPIDAIEALRPAAVKFLSPAAVGAMTRAQLQALTPRQVAALRPLQLAALTPAERALLRR